MGGLTSSSQNTTQQSQTQPWAAAMPMVNSLMSQVQSGLGSTQLTPDQQSAIAQLTASGQAGNPYAGSVGNVASNMLSGGNATGQIPALQQNLAAYQAQMSPYASSSYSSLNSPQLQAALQQAGRQAADSVNSQFAAAGRSGSGMNAQQVAQGISAAQTPLLLNQFNQDQQTAQNAMNSLYGAGNTTSNAISALQQQSVANQQAGIGAAQNALDANNWGANQVLNAQNLLNSIPTQNLGLLAQIGLPLANLGSTSSGTSQTTQNPSLLSSLMQGAGLLKLL